MKILKRMTAIVLSAALLAAGAVSTEVSAGEVGTAITTMEKSAKKTTALSTYWSKDSKPAKKLRNYVKKVTNGSLAL